MHKFILAFRRLKEYTNDGQLCALVYCTQTLHQVPYVAFFEENEPTDSENYHFIKNK